jgi:predicted RNase H-like HicB family nuclease
MGYEFKTEKNSDYNDSTNYWLTVPLYQQAFKWFREKYEYEVNIHKLIEEDGFMASIGWMGVEDIIEQVEGNTYEEAELACLRKLIEIVKEKV